MTRLACGFLLAATLVTTASAADDAPRKPEPGSPAEARQRWLRGNTEEARTLYEALAKQPKLRAVAGVGLSRTYESEGEYDKALKAIDDALADAARDADLLARRAELLHFRGRWDEALADAEKAIAKKADHFLARWVRGCVYRDRGEAAKAETEFRWFVRTYSQLSEDDKDIKDADTLLLVGQAGIENARTNPNLSDQFRFILREVYGDALKYDPDQWQAEYHAGMLLLEKYNRGEALSAFDNALKINPSAAEVHAGRGVAALSSYELKEAELDAEEALKTNPRLPAALRLRADLHVVAGDFTKALEQLAVARGVNPRDESTLARVAACHFLTKQKDKFDAVVAEAERNNPKCGRFYHELASVLDERRHFPDAEVFYLKASEKMPKLPAPRQGLGLLYMRMGREADARPILKESFDADPFNIRVANTRKVLRHLDRYATLKTEHFEIRYDPKNDKLLAEYMAPYVERLYEKYAAEYGYRPKGPILFEVFNNHEMFSGRVVSLPDLHTIGACTGQMFAMVSPQGKGINKAFNWGRVVRHELVHIFNLEQTRFQVPHWLTEGLAVSQEGFPRPPIWNTILKERAAKNDFLNLDNITLGFVKPKSQAEWNLAYCQSHLYVEYVRKVHGPKAIGQLLAAYGDGLSTGDAVKKVCGVEQAEFEKGYRKYVDGVVQSIRGVGKGAELPNTLAKLEEAHEKSPNDAEVSAKLAELYVRKNKKKEARELVEKVLEAKPGHPTASVVKARLLVAGGDDDGARKVLEAALDMNDPDPQVLLALGKDAFEAKDFKKAADYFERGRKLEPLDPAWLRELAKVYGQTEETDKLIAVLSDLAPTDADDLATRKKLARLSLDAKDWPRAESAAREALEIDVTDPDSQAMLLDALKGVGGRDEELSKLRKLFGGAERKPAAAE
jgi:tetratricopeptide (TPR) repeat protein